MKRGMDRLCILIGKTKKWDRRPRRGECQKKIQPGDESVLIDQHGMGGFCFLSRHTWNKKKQGNSGILHNWEVHSKTCLDS